MCNVSIGLQERLEALAVEHPDLIPQRAVARGGVPACPTAYWRGHKFCQHTIVKLNVLAAASGALLLDPIQGSYSTSTSASANTHAGGGAGDLAHWNYSETQDNWLMNLARDVAFLIYWDRDPITGVWADHGHFIDPSCPNLSSTGAAQVVDFHDGRNGLANDGPDFGSRKSVAKLWNMYLNRSKTTVASIEALFPQKDWFDMADKADLIAAVKDPSVLAAIAQAVGKLQIRHPDVLRGEAGETIDWTTSAWSANHYSWLTFKDARDTLVTLRDFIAAETVDDAARAAAQAEALAKLEALLAEHEEPTTPEPSNPWPALTGPAYGVDTSGHQTLSVVRSIASDPKWKFAIVKATEGHTFYHDTYDEQMEIYRVARLFTGAYAFGWLNQDPLEDLQWFIEKAQLRLGEIAVFDVEDWGETDPDKPDYAADKAMRDATSWEERLDHVIRWLEGGRSYYGAPPWTYMNWRYLQGLRRAAGMVLEDGTVRGPSEQTEMWKRLTAFPLWLADSTPIGKLPSIDGGWNAGLAAHQFATYPYDQNYIYAQDVSGLWWASGARRNYAA